MRKLGAAGNKGCSQNEKNDMLHFNASQYTEYSLQCALN